MADHDNMSPREIEDDIERERAALGDTLEEVHHRLSFENMTKQVTEGLRDNSGEIARSVSNAVRDNPVALALTGVGLAWLVLGSGRDTSHAGRYGDPYDDIYADADEDDYDPFTRADFGAGSRYGGTSSGAPTTARDLYERRARSGDGFPDDDEHHGFGDRISEAGQAIRDKLRGAGDKVRDAAGRTRQSASGTTGSAQERARAARDSARRGSQRLRASASQLRDRASHGLEGMSDMARDRVMQAREAAIEARERAQRMGAQGRDRAADMYEEQPLVAGALALAFGVALGAMLPRTRYEDDVFGEESDHLMDEAERIYREERAKLENVASAAADEARRMGSEATETLKEKADPNRLVEQAESAAKSAGKRVSDAARDEAERQDLGGSVRGEGGDGGGHAGSGNRSGSKAASPGTTTPRAASTPGPSSPANTPKR